MGKHDGPYAGKSPGVKPGCDWSIQYRRADGTIMMEATQALYERYRKVLERLSRGEA